MLRGRPSGKTLISGALGVVAAAFLLGWCIQRAGLMAIADLLVGLSFLHLLPALACEALVQASKALKWKSLLNSVAPVRYRSCLSGVVIGAAATHLVPLRLDELLRSAVLARREGLPTGTVLGTVALDRLADIGVVALLLVVLPLLHVVPPELQPGMGLLSSVFAGVLVLLAVLVSQESRLRSALESSRLPGASRLAELLGHITQGLRAIPRGRHLAVFLVALTTEWAATVALYLWLLSVFTVAAPWGLGLLMTLGNSVAYSIPNVPAALGTFEAIQVGLLEQVAGLGPAEAMALALTAHAILSIPVTLCGLGAGVIEWRRTPTANGLST